MSYGQLAVAGPVPETYLVGPRDTNDTAAWRTEIGLSGLSLVRDEMEAHGSRAFTSWQPR